MTEPADTPVDADVDALLGHGRPERRAGTGVAIVAA